MTASAGRDGTRPPGAGRPVRGQKGGGGTGRLTTVVGCRTVVVLVVGAATGRWVDPQAASSTTAAKDAANDAGNRAAALRPLPARALPMTAARLWDRRPSHADARWSGRRIRGVDLSVVPIEKPDDQNVILGQSHFIKTVEDLHEALVGISPHLRFGIAFCEASGPCLIRRSGNDDQLVRLAVINAEAVAAGHSFIVFLTGGYPVNVLNAIKQVPEVCRIFCATANPLEVVVAETDLGRAILGVVDGLPPAGVETDDDEADRRALLRQIGYKL